MSNAAFDPSKFGNYEGLVLLFNTVADPARAARLHSKECAMVNTAGIHGRTKRGKRTTTHLIEGAYLAEDISDLNERGFPVKRCKCCGG